MKKILKKLYKNIFIIIANFHLAISQRDTINWKYFYYYSLRTPIFTFDFYKDYLLLGTNKQSLYKHQIDFLSPTNIEQVEILTYFILILHFIYQVRIKKNSYLFRS